MELNSIEELIDEIRRGKMIILMDDEDRENEGDLIMAASLVRDSDINFMATNARGLICLTLTRERCEQLQLPLMVDDNGCQHGTNFTLSIEAATGVTTGISAADRALTARTAVERDAKPEDIVQPGHIFPLMARPGGVLHRAGHTEAGCDFARLAGMEAAAVIVEIMNEDGTMARRPDLEIFAKEHDLKIGTIADLIHYRTVNEKTVESISKHELETKHGVFQLEVFRSVVDGGVHLAVSTGDLKKVEAPTVRVHMADPFRDLLGATLNGRQGWSLDNSLAFLAEQDAGVVIVLGQKFDSDEMLQRVDQFYSNKTETLPTTTDGTSVYRTIGTGSQILRELGIKKMKLMSSRLKFNALSGFDLEIVEYIESES
ncbi:MAG: 3,4-dihydroxy-2-butanone-4-phosphate synthase [Pseudomonadales bacterium]|nr:3,4-dihydroxy-2-butanone-4-phosphate synthase [Pseudomonadales bacterium]